MANNTNGALFLIILGCLAYWLFSRKRTTDSNMGQVTSYVLTINSVSPVLI